MEKKSKGVLVVLLAVLCLLFVPLGASAQTYTYSIYVDSDARASTGCSEGPVVGAEVRLRVTASGGLTPQVQQVTRARCSGAVFGSDAVIAGSYPVGADNGTAGSDVIELADDLSQLISNGSPSLVYSIVATSSSGEDDLLTSNGAAGGPPIALGLPAVAIPLLGVPALILMAVLLGMVGMRVARRRGLWRVLALLSLVSGVALAANFVVDGQVGDWNGVAPLATDPAGDASSGESAIDLRAFFAAIENDRVYMRVDVTNLQNNAPTAVTGSATTLEDQSVTVSLSGTDNENDALTFAIVTVPANGSLGAVVPTGPQSATVQYTPNPDSNGSDSFTFTVDDGQATSAPATISLTVTPVNDMPGFTSGASQTVLEDAGGQTVNAWATAISAGPANESAQVLDFVVSNDNNALFSAQPAVSPAGVLSYTPAADANGSATVTVSLHDNGGTANGGVDTSPAQTFTITVTAVNDAPSFSAGPNQSVPENAPAQTVNPWATAISAGAANESGQVLNFIVSNDNNALFSVQPAVSPGGALTFTPAATVNGSATVTLNLMDDGGTANGGVDTSAAQTFTITVAGINDPPSFTAGPDQTVLEDAGAQSVNPWATAISPGPPNESGQTVTFNVTGNTNASLFSAGPAISSTGVLTYTPAANAFGSATITLVAMDNGGTANGGVDTSPPQSFLINVTAVNDPPALDLNGPAAGTGFAATYTEGDPAVAIVDAAALTMTDVDNANLASATVTITNLLDGASESLTANTAGTSIVAVYTSASGILSLTGSDTVANYQTVLRTVRYLNSSTAPSEVARSISFLANDGSDDSNVATSVVTVIGVNTIPSYTGGPPVVVNEDAGAQTIPNWATAINDNDGGAQTLNFTLTPSGGSLTFSSAPALSATGTLTFTTASDASGSATFNVVLIDSGSNNNTSAAQTLTITANAVNDAPSFTAGADPTVLEDAGAQTVAGWASAISPGPADESGQTVSFNITGNTNAALFSTGPTVSPTGTLSFTPAANANGSATITLSLMDNGGTANGGVDTSAPQSFTINVTAVNDVPSFAAGANQTVDDSAGPQTVSPWATAISPGPANESGQTVSFVIDSNSAPAIFAAGPSVSSTGVLTFTPATVASGTTTATIVLHAMDNGGTANGGVDASATQSFTIAVSHFNAPPVFTTDPISYATAGNTQLHVAGATSPGLVSISDAQSALAKSLPTDPDGPVAPSVVAASGASFNGGNFAIATNGSFTYVPPAGFAGTDTFTFQVTDGNLPTPGIAVGTASITVGPTIWYVSNLIDANNPAGGDGRSTNAFDTLAGAQAASGNGDIIFVFRGNSGATPLTGGIVLKDGQRLWGEGYGLNIAPFGTLVAAGLQPRINAVANAVSVPAIAGNRVGIEIRGLDLQGNPNAIDMTATAANNAGVTISGNTVSGSTAEGIDVNFGSTGSQQIAIQNNTITAGTTGIDINRTVGVGTITAFNDNTISGNTGGSGVVAAGVTFDAIPGNPINTVNGGVTVIGAAGNGTGASGLLLGGVSGDLAFNDLEIFNDSGYGLRAHSTGALNAAAGTGFRISVVAGAGNIVSFGGPAVDVGLASIALQLGNVQSTNSSMYGINLGSAFGGIGATGFSAATGQVVNPASYGLIVVGGNGSVSFGGTITSTTGNAVYVRDRTSDAVTLNGAISDTGLGIFLTNNTGATIDFNGALTLNTGTNAFIATAGGTVSASNPGNMAATTLATAINVANTTIGAGNLIFRSVSAGTGAPSAGSGIILNNTGSIGRLLVTGNGSAGSGGTIRNKDIGISLTNTLSPSFSWMQLNNFADYAIRGQTVNGFTLANSVINGANGNNAAADEGSVRFDELTGVANITNSSISGGFEDNFKLVNTAGSLNRLTFDTVTIGTNSLTDGNDGITLEAAATAVLNVTVQNSNFTASRGDLFQFNHIGNGGGDLVLTNNTFSNSFPAIATGGGGLSLFTSGLTGGNVTMSITGNSFRDAVGPGVLIVKSTGPATLSGTFDNNTIGVSGVPNSGSSEGSALKLQTVGDGTMSWTVTNNQIRGYNNFGIEVLAGGGATAQGGIINTTVTGNLIAEPGNTAGTLGIPKNGIHYNIGTVVGDTYQACANIGGAGALANEIYLGGADSVPASGLGDIDFRIRNRRVGVNINLPGYAGPAAASDATINAYLVPRNSQGGVPFGAAHGVTGTYSGVGTSCP